MVLGLERLWTPWRMQYVASAEQSTGCFLCEKPREQRDAENLILWRGERVFAILNLFPYNTGHTMVAPYAHEGDLTRLDSAIAAEMMAALQRMVRVIGQEYRPDGFNIGMNLGRVAGAGVPDHLHIHIVPRWGGDTNFMVLTANTKVMPETLDRTYERLRARLARDG
jgi:ATP adenylyltransferase